MSEAISCLKSDPKYFTPTAPAVKPSESKKPAVDLDAHPTTVAPAAVPKFGDANTGGQSVDVATWSTPLLERNAHALHMRLAKDPKSVTAAEKDLLLKVEAELTKRYAKEKESAPAGKVQLCERPADLPGNSAVGLMHHWIKTPNKEAGMGPAGGGVPGHKDGPSGYPGMPTTLNDHKGEVPVKCTPYDKVDVDCVDRELEIGKSTGRWTPPFNDCHTVAADILKKCAVDGVDPYAYEHNKESDAGVP